MKRRKFLKIAGGTGVILAAGAGGFIATRTPHAALAPWRLAGSADYPDPMRRALSYAILAPNPHNRQPWLVELTGEREAILSCDLDRLLPETDPYSRQIVIGLGCFLELFTMAAAHDGYRAGIDLWPQGEPGARLDDRPIARLKLTPDEEVSGNPLFRHALDRHTNRNAYDMTRPVSEDELAAIRGAAGHAVSAGGVIEGSVLTALRSLTRDAFRGELQDAAAYQESVNLMRIGRAEIEANPDGVSLDGPFLEALSLVGLLSRRQLADTDSFAFQSGLDMAEEQALTAMGFLWINTRENERHDQIEAGRAYLRAALQVTALGLAMQPMSQALQEYDAMRPYYDRVHAMLARDDGERVQMLARLGHAAPVSPAPRWRLATRVHEA